MRQQLRRDLDLRTFEIDGNTYFAVQLEEFPKYYATTSGHIISTCYKEDRVLAAGKRGDYLQVRLANNGEDSRKSYYVHRLIAEAFYEAPDNDRNGNPRCQVNHINGIKTDNKQCNLEFLSAKENIQHHHQVLTQIRDHFHSASVAEQGAANA